MPTDAEYQTVLNACRSRLVMRQGVETIKPDIHIKNFLRQTTGRPFTDQEAVSLLERVAKDLNRPANELDWSIWETQRNAA